MSTYYEALPIYKAATDMVVSLDKVVRGFSRYRKYTLGSRMRETAIDIVLLISRANRREDRERLLPELCRRVDELRLLVNLGKEVSAFPSFNQFAQVMEQVLLRIGAYAECARWQDARALGLRLALRRGRARTAGLPWRKVSGLVQRGLNRGLRVAVAFEEPLPSGNVKARRLAYLFEPAPRDAPASLNVMPPAGKEDRHG